MKNLIILTIMILIIGCNKETTPQNDELPENALLAKNVTAVYPTNIDNKDNPEWTKNINWNELFTKTFKKVFAEEVKAFGGNTADFEDPDNQELMPIDIVHKRLNWLENNNYSEHLKEILFYEKWLLNPKSLNFNKQVLGWCPVRFFQRDGNTMKQKVTYLYPEDKGKGKQIAKSIFYEVQWFYEYHNAFTGFDRTGFIKSIVDAINSGNINAYDPIYLVDKTKKKFNKQQLIDFIGQELNPGLLNYNMGSILFEEDWYFDENTLSIQKEVKSFAFVQNNYNPEAQDWTKKILFFIFPK